MSCPFLQMLHFNFAADGNVSLLDRLTHRQACAQCADAELKPPKTVELHKCDEAHVLEHIVHAEIRLGCGCSKDMAM